MNTVEREIVVKAPLEQVYNQWTQFEEFPRFMEGVKEVQQLSDRRLYWRAEVFGHEAEWEAEIQQQLRDQRIAWHATTGRQNSGVVRFEPWDMGETKVMLELSYELEGVGENIADALGLVGRRVEGDLERFRDFIEERAHETGAWRGELPDLNPPDERAIAEERQREPGLAAGPGGIPLVDERSDEIENGERSEAR